MTNFYIKEIQISNFRGIESQIFEFSRFSDFISIIGDNGSNKSTVLSALLKALVYSERKKNFEIEDSFDNLLNDITIRVLFSVDKDNGLASEALTDKDKETGENLFEIELIGKYNRETSEYDSTVLVGRSEKMEFQAYSKLPSDNYINVVYIPSFISNEVQSDFIKSKIELLDDDERKKLEDSLKESITTFNGSVSANEAISEIQKSLSSGINDIDYTTGRGMNIAAKSFFRPTKIHTNLSFAHIKTTAKNASIDVYDHGDGFKRMLDALMLISSFEDSKVVCNICLIEEPENHMFFNFQKTYIALIKKTIKNGIIFLTTHSPNIIDLSKRSTIIRMDKSSKPPIGVVDEEIENYYFYQQQICEAIFYRRLILVEGHSEFMFFKHILAFENDIQKIAIEKSVGIVNISSAHFSVYKKFFESIGIKTYIMTDADYDDKTPNFAKRLKKLCENFPEIIGAIDLVIAGGEFGSVVKKMLNSKNIFVPKPKVGQSIEFEDALAYEGFIDKNHVSEQKKHKLKNIFDVCTKSDFESILKTAWNKYDDEYEGYLFSPFFQINREGNCE